MSTIPSIPCSYNCYESTYIICYNINFPISSTFNSKKYQNLKNKQVSVQLKSIISIFSLIITVIAAITNFTIYTYSIETFRHEG